MKTTILDTTVKFYILLSILMTGSCKKDGPSQNAPTTSSSEFSTVIAGGQTLKASYCSCALPTTDNTFGYQATNRAIFFAYYNGSNNLQLDVWTKDKKPSSIIVNHTYTSTGSWMQNQDDVDFSILRMGGKDVDWDYSEVVFSKYSVTGDIEGTYTVKYQNKLVLSGSFKFTAK